MSTGHKLGVGDEDTDGESVFLSWRSAEKRLQGSELSPSKQQLARQEKLGLPQRPSPKSLPADEGKHNFTNDSLMEHRQGQRPVPLLWIVTLQITGTDSGDVPDNLRIHLLLASIWSTIHQTRLIPSFLTLRFLLLFSEKKH